MFISPVEQLIEGLQSPDRLDLEFKECRDVLSQDLWETDGAFANTQGGWLLLGVTNKGIPVGVRIPDKLKTELFNLRKEKDHHGAYHQILQSLHESACEPTLFDRRNIEDVDKDLRAKREELRQENEILRQVRKSLRQKMRREQKAEFITQNIIRLCRLRPQSSGKLAEAFRMSAPNIITRYVGKLMQEGKIQWTGRTKNDKAERYVAPYSNGG